MIVNESAPPKPKSEDEQKENMLDQLRSESLAIICLATIYAKSFENLGIDVTHAWETAEQQGEILRGYYNKGYKEGYIAGIAKGKEIERAEQEEVANE